MLYSERVDAVAMAILLRPSRLALIKRMVGKKHNIVDRLTVLMNPSVRGARQSEPKPFTIPMKRCPDFVLQPVLC